MSAISPASSFSIYSETAPRRLSFWDGITCSAKCGDACRGEKHEDTEDEDFQLKRPYSLDEGDDRNEMRYVSIQPVSAKGLLASFSTDLPRQPEYSFVTPAHMSDELGGRLADTAAVRSVRGKSPSPAVNPLSGLMTLVVSACDYKADLQDPVDVRVAQHFRTLGAVEAAALMVRKLAMCEYELGGTRVSVRWIEHSKGSELIAREPGANAPSTEVTFDEYLQQAALIAADINSGLPRTLTFTEKGVPLSNEATSEERFAAMQNAAKQAKIRAKTADQHSYAGR